MIERGQHLRFALEPGQPLRVVDEGVGEDLQRDITVELRVPGFVDLPHAARADGGEDFVGAEGGAGLKGHLPLVLFKLHHPHVAFVLGEGEVELLAVG